MSILAANWTSLYKLQDNILHLIKDELSQFYLTGGTALSRYYLNHRYSEDLDFFCHDKQRFETGVNRISRLLAESKMLNPQMTQISETYARFFVGRSSELKIDFVYENIKQTGNNNIVDGINIDNPKNILANKICCVIGRDEPKDVFDIVSIAQAYSFNWRDTFLAAKRKQVLDETDVAMRLESFPVEWFENLSWVKSKVDTNIVSGMLKQIVLDIMIGGENSLGEGKPKILG